MKYNGFCTGRIQLHSLESNYDADVGNTQKRDHSTNPRNDNQNENKHEKEEGDKPINT